MIVLVGFMGAGKSTIGRLVAARLGLPFLDTDEVIARKAGMPIPDIFASEGEPSFRELEREVVLDLADTAEAVLAIGAGGLTDPLVRTALSRHDVVYLKVSYGEAIRRIGFDANRPMLRRDPKALYEERLPYYQGVAKHTIVVDGRSAGDIAMEIARTLGGVRMLRDRSQRIVVALGPRTYDILVGSGYVGELPRLIPDLDRAENVFVVTHPSLSTRANDIKRSFDGTAHTVHVLEVPEGEGAKSLDTAAVLLEQLADRRAHRDDVVVALGGGVIGDVAGFVAATYARGMNLVNVPTTLLAQVDAAIGGKNGVNLPHAKNLVGTFHQPRLVVCDVDVLLSLPKEEIGAAMAEVIKYGLIADPELLDVVRERKRGILEGSTPELIEVVGRCAAIKASYVMADERDTGVRAHLNYGHTFAHAIEASGGFGGISHGHAVSLGMMAAAYLAEDLGRLTEADCEVHRRALLDFDLPVRAELDFKTLERAWTLDKKYRKGLRFVLLRRIGQAEHDVEAPVGAVQRALARMSA